MKPNLPARAGRSYRKRHRWDKLHGEVKCFKFQISAADGAGARNGIEKSAVVVRLPAAGGGCARRGIYTV